MSAARWMYLAAIAIAVTAVVGCGTQVIDVIERAEPGKAGTDGGDAPDPQHDDVEPDDDDDDDDDERDSDLPDATPARLSCLAEGERCSEPAECCSRSCTSRGRGERRDGGLRCERR